MSIERGTDLEQDAKFLKEKRERAARLLEVEDQVDAVRGAVGILLAGEDKREQILGSLKNVRGALEGETARAARSYFLERRAFKTAHPEVDPK
jgi:hypothetical protein